MRAWLRKRIALGLSAPNLLLLIVTFLTVYPLVMIVLASFHTGTPGDLGNFTLDGYRGVLELSGGKVFFTTLWLAVIKTLISMSIAVCLAWIVARTDAPFLGVLRFLTEIRFFMPSLPFTISWMLLLAPKSGLINVLFMHLFNVNDPLFNIFSYAGIIFVGVMGPVPIMFMIILPALVNLDASLEEACRTYGGGKWATFTRITIPVVWPAIAGAALLCFITNLESFEEEAYLGVPAGIFVVTTKIYWTIHETTPTQYNVAMAYATLLILAMTILILYQWKTVSTAEHKFVTVTGRGYAVRPFRLGPWKYLASAMVIGYFLLSTLLPAIFVVLGSFMKFSGIFMGDWFTLEHWQSVLNSKAFWRSFWNSVTLGVCGATLGLVLMSLISYVIVRTRYKGRGILNFLSWLPTMMPSIVLALGLLWVYVGGVPRPFILYGSIWLLVIGVVTKRMPYLVRIMNGVMVQISRELEAAARIHGATWLQTFRYIFIPLVRPGILNAWIMMFIFSVKELVICLMLYGSKTKTMSVEMFISSFEGGKAEEALVIAVMELALIIFAWFAFRLVVRCLFRSDTSI
jgi:iron(III) transport system permease protein